MQKYRQSALEVSKRTSVSILRKSTAGDSRTHIYLKRFHFVKMQTQLLLLVVVIISGAESKAVPNCKYGAQLDAESGKCVCPQLDCSKDKIDEVCGTNAVTYNNKCEIEKENCEIKMSTSVFKKGACERPRGLSCASLHCPVTLTCIYGYVQDQYGCISECKCINENGEKDEG